MSQLSNHVPELLEMDSASDFVARNAQKLNKAFLNLMSAPPVATVESKPKDRKPQFTASALEPRLPFCPEWDGLD